MAVLLNKYYNKNSNAEFVDYDGMKDFLDVTLSSKYDSFLELYQDMESFQIKTISYCRKIFLQSKNINKNGFVHMNIMKFPKTTFVTDGTFLYNFLENVHNIIFGRETIHHSYITGEVSGYTHSFCNQKVRENKNQISVIAHNLFGFDIFLKKCLRQGVWQTTNLSIGDSNLTNGSYANISKQIKVFDTRSIISKV